MQKVSEIIGKIAITLFGACRVGTVLDVYFDAGLEKCRVLSLIGEEDELFWTDFKSVCAFGSDAVIIKNPQDVFPFPPPANCFKSPVNLPSYNQDGGFLGNIRDLLLDGERVDRFVADKEIPAATIISHSDGAVVFNDSGTPIKIKKPAASAKKTVKKEEDISAKTAKNDAITVDSPAEIARPFKLPLTNVTLLPNSVLSTSGQNKYAFLLGKKLSRTIYNQSGRAIARENDSVTEEIILRAKEEGKLMSLALHSV